MLHLYLTAKIKEIVGNLVFGVMNYELGEKFFALTSDMEGR